MFWLCKFVFGAHPYYAMKPLYFQLDFYRGEFANDPSVSWPLVCSIVYSVE